MGGVVPQCLTSLEKEGLLQVSTLIWWRDYRKLEFDQFWFQNITKGLDHARHHFCSAEVRVSPTEGLKCHVYHLFWLSTVCYQLVEVFGSKYCPSSSHKENNEVLHEKVIITSMWLIKCKWMSQVAKRLEQEQDDKDLMIVLEDLPLVKVIFNSKGCCWNHL